MDAATEARLAKIINSDLEQLREKAEVQGVLAYGLKPVRRERLNDRFLQNTLKSVDFANKKADEDSMWASRQRQQDSRGLARRRTATQTPTESDDDTEFDKRHRAHTSTRSEASSLVSGWECGDAAVLDKEPSAKRRKGRGGRGLKSQDAGPFLPAGCASDWDREATKDVQLGAMQGPTRPLWLARAESPSSAADEQVTNHGSARPKANNQVDVWK
ncbi:hypothetical protein WJX84_003656 [Apatococcus fuscideae]|uniref:Uncharacterized protein n=1 Tax=Apatococcus fuscideae TaxID=2026836 RepID=A0AAW1TM05_9CHLO